ncbi:NAD(P)-dependent dehydrogenase (short-subunit alcohol dehydrogenase family) [Peribacillus cavernae]|nr:hypothetical protein [Peribacillus cavernae]MDQ0221130.1 NAD(P)-dependent dehydrogenase (short-subunit alcohol dehydrogenase family) [Peribacillus cavernae]
MSSLKGKIAVVAGATRGAGRGIAVKLGEAGAIVYVTDRTTKYPMAECVDTIRQHPLLLSDNWRYLQ